VGGGKREYDVALSFAGGDREYVEEVAEHLRLHHASVFYDRYEQVRLWGKDLYTHLADIYRNKARYCVVFISAEYAQRVWTSHEAKSAQSRALEESVEYILPARFDDTELPGLLPTTAYIELVGVTPIDLTHMILEKLRLEPEPELPDRPRTVSRAVGADSKHEKRAVERITRELFRRLQMCTTEEREILWHALSDSCAAELPSLHVGVDWVRRSAEMEKGEVVAALANMSSIGLSTRLRYFDTRSHPDEVVSTEPNDLLLEFSLPGERRELVGMVLLAMADCGYLCRDHAKQTFVQINFRHLGLRKSQIEDERCMWGRY
jgi:hypothetical protein